jgi:hypothetical protein
MGHYIYLVFLILPPGEKLAPTGVNQGLHPRDEEPRYYSPFGKAGKVTIIIFYKI